MDCTSPRPVLLLGPLVDPVKDMLVKESPGKFSRCVLGELTLVHSNNIVIKINCVPIINIGTQYCRMCPDSLYASLYVYMDLVIFKS